MSGNCKHCMGDCKYEFTEEIYEKVDLGGGLIVKEFKGYEHGCRKNPEGYKKWWLENNDKSLKEASNMDCFDPTELTDSLIKMNALAQQILDSLESKKNIDKTPDKNED